MKTKMKTKRIIGILLATIMLCSMCVNTFAASNLDFTYKQGLDTTHITSYSCSPVGGYAEYKIKISDLNSNVTSTKLVVVAPYYNNLTEFKKGKALTYYSAFVTVETGKKYGLFGDKVIKKIGLTNGSQYQCKTTTQSKWNGNTGSIYLRDVTNNGDYIIFKVYFMN